MTRIITAPKIHDGQQWLPAGTAIVLDDRNTIQKIIPLASAENVVHSEGIICPAWVNAHCHLELSHLKGAIPKHTGLQTFLKSVVLERQKFNADTIAQATEAAAQSLYQSGVAAVGDIANTSDTLNITNASELLLHTFVECIGFDENVAQKSFERSQTLLESFRAADRQANICAHAPYSVSKKLFQLIAEAADSSLPQTIHNQEWEAEDELYQSKTGAAVALLEGMGIDISSFVPSQKSSLNTYLPYFKKGQKMLLVHNTFTSESALEAALQQSQQLWFCLCPNANLYIENKLPDVAMLLRHTAQICIGTDSLASNDQLDILSELQTLHRHFKQIPLEQLLTWATYNGAVALSLDHAVGRIQTGLKPGLLHLSVADGFPTKAERIA